MKFLNIKQRARLYGSAIRNDNVIGVFKVLDTESKISQYAHDTTLRIILL